MRKLIAVLCLITLLAACGEESSSPTIGTSYLAKEETMPISMIERYVEEESSLSVPIISDKQPKNDEHTCEDVIYNFDLSFGCDLVLEIEELIGGYITTLEYFESYDKLYIDIDLIADPNAIDAHLWTIKDLLGERGVQYGKIAIWVYDIEKPENALVGVVFEDSRMNEIHRADSFMFNRSFGYIGWVSRQFNHAGARNLNFEGLIKDNIDNRLSYEHGLTHYVPVRGIDVLEIVYETLNDNGYVVEIELEDIYFTVFFTAEDSNGVVTKYIAIGISDYNANLTILIDIIEYQEEIAKTLLLLDR